MASGLSAPVWLLMLLTARQIRRLLQLLRGMNGGMMRKDLFVAVMRVRIRAREYPLRISTSYILISRFAEPFVRGLTGADDNDVRGGRESHLPG
jgi:hypothetical protein